MILEDLGYNENFEKFRIENKLENFEVGRVITEHKERYIIKTVKGEFEAEITGNMRYSAKDRSDYPAVGDWIALTTYELDFAIIHKIFPRETIIERQAIGQFGDKQIIATNLDYALITQAVDRDFNINRIERYLTICNSAKVDPILILSKTDLLNEIELELLMTELKSRIKNVQIIPISNQTKNGYDKITKILLKGKTYCLLGSSGVGKSTLINNLVGQEILKTSTLSSITNKGRHTTSHRELTILENGSILIDNPGMREVGIVDKTDGLEITFDAIIKISRECKYKDCTHIHEKECAVVNAVKNGIIDKTSYLNFLKLEKEKAHFESTVAEKRKKDKEFGKMVKNYQKDMSRNKEN